MLIFDQEASKSTTDWIGCFNEDCSIASVVHGKMITYILYLTLCYLHVKDSFKYLSGRYRYTRFELHYL